MKDLTKRMSARPRLALTLRRSSPLVWMGGLGFLASGPIAFAPVILAQTIVLSALIAGGILFQGETLYAFRYVIAGAVILQLFLVLAPRCVLAPTLRALKRRGRREYGALAACYTHEFLEKWIAETAPPTSLWWVAPTSSPWPTGRTDTRWYGASARCPSGGTRFSRSPCPP